MVASSIYCRVEPLKTHAKSAEPLQGYRSSRVAYTEVVITHSCTAWSPHPHVAVFCGLIDLCHVLLSHAS